MLTCKEVVQLVTDYLEDRLSEEDRLRFEQHVAICPPCRGHVAQMRKTIQMAGKLSEDSIDPEAERALLGAFRDWKQERSEE